MIALVFCFSSVLYLLWHLVRCGITSVDLRTLIKILRMDKWWVNSFNFILEGEILLTTPNLWLQIFALYDTGPESEVSNSKHILLQNSWCFRKFYYLWFEQWNFIILLSLSQHDKKKKKKACTIECFIAQFPLLSGKCVLSFCRNILPLHVKSRFFYLHKPLQSVTFFS